LDARPYLLETLRLLEGFDLTLFVDVPLQALLSDEYTRIRRPLLDMSKASLDIRPGDPDHMGALRAPPPSAATSGGITTICIADRWGSGIALTPSGLGSTAGMAGDRGIIHGSCLVSLNTWKGHPDCTQPCKRPRITLTPTLVLKDNKPVLAISVAGGDL
jgi:gamma-glutamyltranspeptidase/glutathione hydrolase